MGRQNSTIKRVSSPSSDPVGSKSTKMAPVPESRDLKKLIEDHVKGNNVMIFGKTTCPYCRKVGSCQKNVDEIDLY